MIQPRFAARYQVSQDYRDASFDLGPSAREHFEKDRELQEQVLFELPDRLSLTLKNTPVFINGQRAYKGFQPEPVAEAVDLVVKNRRGDIVAMETVHRQLYINGMDPIKSRTMQPLAAPFWDEVLKAARRLLKENPAG